MWPLSRPITREVPQMDMTKLARAELAARYGFLWQQTLRMH